MQGIITFMKFNSQVSYKVKSLKVLGKQFPAAMHFFVQSKP